MAKALEKHPMLSAEIKSFTAIIPASCWIILLSFLKLLSL